MQNKLSSKNKRNDRVYFARIAAFVLLLTFVMSIFSGCESETVVKKYNESHGGSLLSCKVVSSDKYALFWDNDAKSIQLECLETGKVWSNISYDKYLDGSTSVYANSSLTIKVVDSSTLVTDTVTSYAAFLDGGNIVAKQIKGGVQVTYYFDAQKISIPVNYILCKDYLRVSVNTKQIVEGSDTYFLADVSPTPLLCAAENNSENGYLFVPSGQGALMDTVVSPDGARTWTGEVYSNDVSMQRTEEFTNKQPVRLPVFGAKDGNNAIFGIVENAAGNCFISAEAGNKKIGVSSVGPKFFVRGYDTYLKGSSFYGKSVLTQYVKSIDKFNAVIRYYFLTGDKADYNGMAEIYRNYLKDTKKLEKSQLDSKPYAVSYIGGTTINKSILGIPKTKLVALTDFSQIEDSIEDLKKSVGITPLVRLLNFADGGLIPATYLGGKSIPSVYGKKSELSNLLNVIKNDKSHLFFDMDLVYYGNGGNGVAKKRDSAKTAVNFSSEKYNVSPIRVFEDTLPYKVISRDKLNDGVQMALKKAEKYGLNGLSLSTLSNSLYSDYSLEDQNAKSYMEYEAIKHIKNVKKSKKLFASSSPNAYSAVISDIMFDVSVESSDDSAFSTTIPFYQMIFSGYIPMYSNSLNTSENFDKSLAMIASSGIGVGFTFTGEYISQSNDLDICKLYAMPYKNNEKLVKNILIKKGFLDYFDKISGATLIRYDIDENGVSTSTFSNGLKLYANHSSESCDSPIGKLSAFEFKVGESEK